MTCWLDENDGNENETSIPSLYVNISWSDVVLSCLPCYTEYDNTLTRIWRRAYEDDLKITLSSQFVPSRVIVDLSVLTYYQTMGWSRNVVSYCIVILLPWEHISLIFALGLLLEFLEGVLDMLARFAKWFRDLGSRCSDALFLSIVVLHCGSLLRVSPVVLSNDLPLSNSTIHRMTNSVLKWLLF